MLSVGYGGCPTVLLLPSHAQNGLLGRPQVESHTTETEAMAMTVGEEWAHAAIAPGRLRIGRSDDHDCVKDESTLLNAMSYHSLLGYVPRARGLVRSSTTLISGLDDTAQRRSVDTAQNAPLYGHVLQCVL